jgi:hypothetical protein
MSYTGTTPTRLERISGASGLVALTGIVLLLAAFCLTAGTARADGSQPPIPALPAAGDTVPPAEAISDPSVCGGWFRQGLYGGVWPTGSVWWEYSCTYEWPEFGTGATNADWGGQDIWTTHFYWDGSKAVFYGENFYDGYWDDMITASDCTFWLDNLNNWWGSTDCSGF